MLTVYLADINHGEHIGEQQSQQEEVIQLRQHQTQEQVHVEQRVVLGRGVSIVVCAPGGHYQVEGQLASCCR